MWRRISSLFGRRTDRLPGQASVHVEIDCRRPARRFCPGADPLAGPLRNGDGWATVHERFIRCNGMPMIANLIA
jgi:hypothetical protein